jgi:hypothetical protein
MTTTHTPFTLGSVSSGTLRTEDLLPVFAYTLADLARSPVSNILVFKSEHMAEIWQDAIDTIDQDTHPDAEDSGPEQLAALIDAIQEYCPPFVFFGALPGDGADFGFWPDWDALDKPRPWWDSHRTIQVQQDQKVLIQFDLGRSNVTVMDMDRNVLWTTAS